MPPMDTTRLAVDTEVTVLQMMRDSSEILHSVFRLYLIVTTKEWLDREDTRF